MSIREPLAAAQNALAGLAALEPQLDRVVDVVVATLRRKGTIFTCGNGGSAAGAQHLVAELVGRYKSKRKPLRAMFLGGDPGQMSCIANDFAWEDVFARPLRAFGRTGDLLICMSTSGRSPNILAAMRAARDLGIESVAFLGNAGGDAAGLVTYPLVIGSDDTARIQEVHLFLVHCICDQIEKVLVEKGSWPDGYQELADF